MSEALLAPSFSAVERERAAAWVGQIGFHERQEFLGVRGWVKLSISPAFAEAPARRTRLWQAGLRAGRSKAFSPGCLFHFSRVLVFFEFRHSLSREGGFRNKKGDTRYPWYPLSENVPTQPRILSTSSPSESIT
jgi:hypothetical protein